MLKFWREQNERELEQHYKNYLQKVKERYFDDPMSYSDFKLAVKNGS